MRNTGDKKDYYISIILGLLASTMAIIVLWNTKIDLPFFLPFVILIPIMMAGIFIGHKLRRFRKIYFQFIKFGESGGMNWLVDLGILNILMHFFGIGGGLFFPIMKAASFLISNTSSYLINKYWVFEKSQTKKGLEYTSFLIISALGLLVNVVSATIVLFFLSQTIPTEETLAANIAAASGSMLAMAWNFIGYKKIVFKNDTPPIL